MSEQTTNDEFPDSILRYTLTLPDGKPYLIDGDFSIFKTPENYKDIPFFIKELIIPGKRIKYDEFIKSLKPGNKAQYIYEIEDLNQTIRRYKGYHQIIKKDKLTLISAVLFDITTEFTTISNLKDANLEWDATFDAIPDFVALIDTEHTIVRVNKAMADLIGKTPDDIVGTKCYTHMHGTDGPPSICPLLSLLADNNGHVVSLREEKIQKDLLVSVTPRIINDNCIIGCIHIARDITSIKKIETELQEKKDELESIFHQSPIGIGFFDKNGDLVMINPSAVEMLGLPNENEILGLNLFSHIKKGVFADEMIHGKPFRFDHKINFDLLTSAGFFRSKKTGESVFDISVTSIQSDEHEISGYIIQIEDRTEERRAFEQIELHAKFIQMVIDIIPSPVFIKNKHGKYLWCNKSFAAILNLSKDKIIGKEIQEVFNSDETGQIKQMDIDLIAGLPEIRLETRIEISDLVRDVIIQKAAFLSNDGSFGGTVGVVIDITEQKMINLSLTKANRKLAILSSITRHDIINSITSLGGYLLMAEITNQPEQRENCIKKASEMASVISRQISFTKTYQDIGTKPPEWQEISILINEAITHPYLKQASITIENCNILIFAEKLIERVFYNLAENSLRHGQHVKNIKFTGIVEGEDFKLVYTDDGIGIKPEFRPFLFQKEYGKNTGLGLFLSREILSITGIEIEETGVYREGVRFELKVPKGNWRIQKNDLIQ